MRTIYGDILVLTGSRNNAIFVSLFCYCTLTSLVLAAPAALLNQENNVEAERPLVRAKRADEISFGNHQNEPRLEKKSVLTDDSTGAAHDVSKREVDDVQNDVTQEEEEPVIEANDEQVGSSANDEELEAESYEKEEKDANADDDSEESRRDSTIARRKRAAETSEKISSSKQDSFLTHDVKAHPLKRRSLSSHSMMIAENMGGGMKRAERSLRSKRDLSYEELRELMQEEPEYFEEPEEEKLNRGKYFEPQYYNEDAEEEKRNSYDDDTEDEEDEEEFLPPSKEEAIEKEILRYEDVRKLMKQKEEEEAKEAIIDYLLQAAEERLREAVEEEREADLREREEFYHKSRLDKRYPYSYEPYGGRWGALIPGAKRSGDRHSYENLYRLAQALNDNENYDDDEEEERKKK